MASDLQSAVERARMVAAKITGQLHDGPAKRGADSSDESSAKKFASVNDAVGAQLAMLKQQQDGGSTSEEIQVPDKLVGLVIGKGGEQLHRLQSETQCKVVISPDSHGLPDRTFTLIGGQDCIEQCKQQIDVILKRGANDGGGSDRGGYGGGGPRGNVEMIEMKIPGNKCGLVIGKGGETIKRLGEQFGVKLVVVQETSSIGSLEKPLRITGEPDKIEKAKEAVIQLITPLPHQGGGGGGDRGGDRGGYQGGGRGGGNEYGGGGGGGDRRDRNQGGSEAFIKVPGDKAGIVIGKGGESIKDINRRSGAHVEIDKSQRNVTDGSDKMFIIRGTAEQIQFAQQLIYEKITGVQGSNPPNGFFNQQQQDGQQGGGGHGGGGQYDQQYSGSPHQQQQHQQQQHQQQQQHAQQQGWANPYAQQQAAAAAGGAPGAGAQSQDPNVAAAWAAYYQQMYAQQGAAAAGGAPGAGAVPAGGAPATGGAPASVAAPAAAGGAAAAAAAGSSPTPQINSSTGQPDYSLQWVEYYRSLGMHDQAEAILKQTAEQKAAGGGGGAPGGGGGKDSPSQQQQQQQQSAGGQSNGGGQGGGSSSSGSGGGQQQSNGSGVGGSYGNGGGSNGGGHQQQQYGQHQQYAT